MDPSLFYLVVNLAVLLHVTTDAYSGITDDDYNYYKLRQLYDDLRMDAPTSEKRVAPPSYNHDYWGRSETSRVNDNTLFNLFRRSGPWSSGGSSGRWTGSSRITPYVAIGDSVNYKNNQKISGLSNPSTWYGRGWHRALSRSNQPSYRQTWYN